ncbi:MAG: SpoIIE family protein phosphatase [Bacteroidota bacterium]
MKKNITLLCLFILTAILPAQNTKILQIFKIDSSETISLDKFWKFHNGDNLAWASVSFDDSNWDTVDTQLSFDKKDSTVFKGIAWFRLHVYIDSALNDIPLCLLVEQAGASQLFLDGKLIHSLGQVSTNLKEEEKYTPNQIPLSFQYLNPGKHLLAVRYSNVRHLEFFKKYNSKKPGFTIDITRFDEITTRLRASNVLSNFLLISLAIFFFTLGFVHLLFFLFYKKQRTNFYYSIFVFFLAVLFFIPYIANNSCDPELSTKLFYYSRLYILLFFYSMLVLEYSLFKRPVGKYFWFSSIALIAVIIIQLLWPREEFSIIVLISFIISTVAASFSIVIKSIYQKLEGAWIIGTGSLLFLILIVIILFKVMFLNGSLHTSSFFLVILIFLAIVSIPISMSIHLARGFAQTNKNLKKNLVEVEILSLKTIEQEKEKQKILEVQKEVLEYQVQERTKEIVEQKNIIEDKNKDITDSINYSKRIQDAILPPKELKYKIFPNAFVLFKPKDIVSGDFYWFAEKDGKRLIASCDCTGHGVPGALMSMIGNNILNQIVNEKGIISPAEILNELHREIRKALKQDEHATNRDGMDIALITFYSETEIEYAGAQRPLWIVKKQMEELENLQGEKNGAGKGSPIITEIKADKFSVGGYQSETERFFTNHRIVLAKDDCIYISSDGFADQFGGTDGKKFMSKRFKALLLENNKFTMSEQENNLIETIDTWKGKHEQVDDILVIGIRI